MCDRSEELREDSLATELRVDSAIDEARSALARHPHFATRCKHVDISRCGDQVAVKATVPSFYLKQMLVQLVQACAGKDAVVDRIGVTSGEVRRTKQNPEAKP